MVAATKGADSLEYFIHIFFYAGQALFKRYLQRAIPFGWSILYLNNQSRAARKAAFKLRWRRNL
jgi:hypothetical protein